MFGLGNNHVALCALVILAIAATINGKYLKLKKKHHTEHIDHSVLRRQDVGVVLGKLCRYNVKYSYDETIFKPNKSL